MRLRVVTPLSVVVEADDVAHVRAEDDSGAFGILPGHADFVTALSISVATFRKGEGREHHVALHGGMLEVRGGTLVSIATREAVAGDDLVRLENDVLARFRRELAEEHAARQDANRLYLAAIGRIHDLVRPGRRPAGFGDGRLAESRREETP